MSEQPYDLFGEIFQRYFRPAIDAYPRTGAGLVKKLLTLSDDIPDRLAQTRRAATAWAKAETPNARITSELFVITQHGLMYAAGLNASRRALYYLATPPALFDPFVDQVVPLLQERGVFRAEYEGSTLREHLGLAPLPSQDRPVTAPR